MNKLFRTRKNILLILIVIWDVFSILFYWKPYLLEILNFQENIKYEIIGGYISKQFVEEHIYYNETVSSFV